MKKTTKSQTKPSVNWEAVRVLAIELGAREAARRMSINESTVLSRASREKWNLPKRKGGATKASANAITLQSKPGDVLLATHRELGERTKSGLAQATARAAEAAAQAAEPLQVTNTAHLRDLAASAARIFGWDNNDKPGVQLNQQFVITQEQIERIREAADADDPYKKPISEGDAT